MTTLILRAEAPPRAAFRAAEHASLAGMARARPGAYVSYYWLTGGDVLGRVSYCTRHSRSYSSWRRIHSLNPSPSSRPFGVRSEIPAYLLQHLNPRPVV